MNSTELVRWCRLHDWGRHATYADGQIRNLEDVASINCGRCRRRHTVSRIVNLPADPKTIRQWAGY